MPLPFPLLGTLVTAISGGMALSLWRRRRDQDEGLADQAEDPLPYRLARTRQRLAHQIPTLAHLKLHLWQHTLRDFAELHAQIQGMTGQEPALWLLHPLPGEDLPPDAPRLDLPPPDADDLRRILQIAAEVDDWDRRAPPGKRWADRLDPVDLADMVLRGITPELETARDGQTDCPSLAWLLDTAAPAVSAPPLALFGGLRLSPAAQQALHDPHAARAGEVERELRALLALLEALDTLLEEVSTALETLHDQAAAAFGELAIQLHIQPDYDRMADVAMTGETESPRARLARGHHLASLLLALLDVPLLDAGGRFCPEIADLLDAHAVLQARR